MKKFKEKIEKLNLDLKKEVAILTSLITLSLAISFVVYFLTNNLVLLSFGLIVSLGIIYFLFKRYDYMLENRRRHLEMEFIEVFSYLRIYLSNKESVYRSLKQASEYTSIEMKREITNFLERIDDDKSILPFIEFGNSFKNKVIEEVMISLYQMIDGGFTENYLNQFISLFDNFKSRYLKEDMLNRYKKMDVFTTLSLLGSGYILLTMLLIIVNIIGGMTNGF